MNYLKFWFRVHGIIFSSAEQIRKLRQRLHKFMLYNNWNYSRLEAWWYNNDVSVEGVSFISFLPVITSRRPRPRNLKPSTKLWHGNTWHELRGLGVEENIIKTELRSEFKLNGTWGRISVFLVTRINFRVLLWQWISRKRCNVWRRGRESRSWNRDREPQRRDVN